MRVQHFPKSITDTHSLIYIYENSQKQKSMYKTSRNGATNAIL